ncbi:MAG: ABC transporter ATP-binding protein [Actinobacteria bacterium]|jgi:ATP-binding cassette, subfamily B, bacterial PglK|nr:ABC transporter ATP-binding protein [Actinomycetota bacterium]NBY61812.1 ABC transporter ATP-binding protein [Actinomycetota bacterium]NDF83650.1 ABC transporter ATP-binding protein [Actinomycetota bacterium]HBQ52033.1 ATPase [Acidimicrobium sp.]
MKQEVSDSRSSFVVWRLLKSSERRALVGIIFLILVGLILETLSLGIVMPVVAILTQDDYQTKYRWLTDNLGSPSREDLIVIVMLLMVGIYIVRSLFLLWSSWVQKGFSAALSGRLSQRLFTIYLRQPYLFHLQHNSATLMRNSRNANVVVTGGIDPTLVLLTDGLVAIALFTLLIIVEPVGTIITLVAFGVGAWLFQLLTRRRIERWGDQRNLHDGMILQHLQQGLGGAKDVKILGRESEFLDQHEKHLKESLRINRVYSVLQTMPRMYMEILTIAGLAALVISMVLQKQSFTEIIPTLGLFAAAAFRVMPSINRLLGALQTLIYSRAIIASVYADFKLDAPDETKLVTGIPFSEQLELRSVTFQYPTASTPSLQQVSLVVRRGEAVGFVGPSGAGKSTLVDVILGLFAPTAGLVLVDGQDIQKNLRNWQNQIGYVPQSIYLTDDTLRRNVAFGLGDENIDENSVRNAIRLAQLEEFVSSLPENLDTVVGERGVRLSGGQRQRIGIARALYHNPSILVLDEATSSLDTPTEHGVMQAVQALQGSKTVIIVAHRLSTVEYCDRLYRIESSRLIEEGTFDEVVKRSAIKK